MGHSLNAASDCQWCNQHVQVEVRNIRTGTVTYDNADCPNGLPVTRDWCPNEPKF